MAGAALRTGAVRTDRPDQVFFDVTIGGKPAGRIEFELRSVRAPHQLTRAALDVARPPDRVARDSVPLGMS
jgi:hypothetical protein